MKPSAILKGPISLQTYVSLTCTNCPDVVQALNIMALLNGQVTHEMIDGALFQEEVDALKIQGIAGELNILKEKGYDYGCLGTE